MVITMTVVAAGAGEAAEPQGQGDDLSWLNPSGLPIVNEPVSYDLLAPRSPTQGDWNKMWVFDEMERRTGIRWNIETVDSAGWSEKKSLAFATGELPDFFMTGLDNFDVINYGSQGVLTPLSELIDEYAPNITSILEARPDIRKSIAAPDGRIYHIPSMNLSERERSQRRSYINTTWLDNLGLEIPETIDEFYDVLRAFKDEDANLNGDPNDEIPAGGMYNAYFAIDIPVLVAFGFVNPRIDTVDGRVVFVPVQDNYREYLRFMERLYSEELLDPEYFIQDRSQFVAKGSQDKYGVFSYWASWVMTRAEESYNQYWGWPPMTSEFNSKQMWPASSVSLSGGYAIVSDTAKKEGLVRLIDYFWTLEGRMMVRVGPESGKWDGEGGFTWAETASGGRAFEFDVPERFSSFNEFREQLILPMAIPYGDDGTMSGYFTNLDPRQVKLTSVIIDNWAPHYKLPYPNAMLTQEENEQINLLQTDIYTYVEQMEAKFMTGDEPLDDSSWDRYVETVEELGLEELLRIRQAAYDRWNQ